MEPHAKMIIDSKDNWKIFNFKELWRYRELFYFLVWRDIKVRYKQTVLGAAWAILQPILSMIIFSVIFGRFAKLPSEGIPYPVFTFAALLPWQLFSYALTNSSNSLVNEKNLITKVYFPRIIIPFSSVVAGLLDFMIASVIFLVMMIFYQIPFTWRLLLVPVFIGIAVMTALSVGLWLTTLNVKYRDIRYVIPFLSQFWLYATPIAYSSSLIPDQWMWLYSLNPMVGVVDGFRWMLLGTAADFPPFFYLSIIIVILLLISGFIYFKKTEDTFADVI
jgi:lipopolysaccharide transport system permease protein